MRALARDRGDRTPSASYMAHELDQFCMRNGIVTGALVVSQYVRQVFPYERAHEAGMGIANPDAFSKPPQESDEALEERLLAQELQELREAEPELAHDVLELSVDELLLEEDDEEPQVEAVVRQSSEPTLALDGEIRLDAFDEDSDVKPVVLLSPKGKPQEPEEGGFLGELERRLAQEAETSNRK